MDLRRELDRRIRDALAAAGAPDAPALVAASAKPAFGDYQANGVMAAAKKLKTKPHDLAERVVAAAKLDDLAEKVAVAGPGFINITLREDWLADQLAEELGRSAQAGQGRFVAPAEGPQTIVIDYSSPNLAKEMHVGHLRSTIIGDAVARVLAFLGHNVKPQNHVGDWGTQFGMLIAYEEEWTREQYPDDPKGKARLWAIPDMEEFYRQAKKRFDEDPEFADKAREYVVRLQAGDDPDIHFKWENVVQESLNHCFKVYRVLGVMLTDDNVCGESFYNEDLPQVIKDLEDKGLIQESQGAQCVFLPQFANKDGEITPFIVQKTDGGYLYATTDLAAIRRRVGHGEGQLGGQRLLYVTDSRQGYHFAQLFAVAREAGFAPAGVALEHVPFGLMLGGDHRPFKTREGGTIKLMDLLDEAVDKAYELVSEKSPAVPEDVRREIARIVGIGAVKYADLSQNRTSDYVFSWGKMLSLEGNTAPYMQYAYARIRSIFRKGEVAADELRGAEIAIAESAERALAVKLLQLVETLQAVAGECLPNLLCGYLYELACAFMSFYESCPVLKAEGAVRASRLALCDLTARTIRCGLELLGIETVEQM